MLTIDQLIRDRAGDTRVGLAFSDRTWTHDEVVRAQAERAALLLSLRRPGPFHVALLMDNLPEYVYSNCCVGSARKVIFVGDFSKYVEYEVRLDREKATIDKKLFSRKDDRSD